MQLKVLKYLCHPIEKYYNLIKKNDRSKLYILIADWAHSQNLKIITKLGTLMQFSILENILLPGYIHPWDKLRK